MEIKNYGLYFGWGNSLKLDSVSNQEIELTEKNNNCVVLYGEKNYLENSLSRKKESLNNLEIVDDRISPWF